MYKKWLTIVVLACFAVVITVTGSIQGSQVAPGYVIDPGSLQLASGGSLPINPGNNPNLPLIIATPTPAPTINPGLRNMTVSPGHTINSSDFARITDGFLTNSSLLYVIGQRNISVIEVKTNKIVDVIYLDKYMLMDAVVTPDYEKLHVLYRDTPDPARVSPGYQSDYGNFILTIDLETKQITDDTWYRDYPDYMLGTASDLVLSPDGRYLYYGNNQHKAAILFEYDTVLRKYTRGVITNGYYGNINDVSSNIYDLTLAGDGKRLYFADINGRLTFVNLPDLSLNRWYKTGVADYHPYTAAVSADGNAAYLAGDSLYATGGYSLISLDLPAIVAKEKDASSALSFTHVLDVVRFGPGEKSVFVLEPSEKRVLAYNIGTPDLYWTYPAGNMPEDYAFSNDGYRLYVYCYGNNNVRAYDLYSRQQLSGSPIRLGADWGLDYQWGLGGNHKLIMGPDPQGNIFVNDSAYRANLMLKLASVIQAPDVSKMAGALELNNSSSGGSSFYFDYALGKIVHVNLTAPGSTAKPTILPGFDLSFPGAVTIRPFPGQTAATPGPQDNQTQNQSQQNASNVTATPGSAGNTSNPGATATPKPGVSATATPGFEAAACLACLAIAMLSVRRKK